MSFKDEWTPRIDGVDDLDSSAVNEIATEVIRLGENQNIEIDTEMSDTSENAVQNKVVKDYIDGTKTELQTYLNEQILGGAW